MRSSVQELERTLGVFEEPPKLTLLRRAEALAWGAPAWMLLAVLFENMVALSLASRLFGNKTIRNGYRACARYSRQISMYGRPLSKRLTKKVNLLKREGVPQHVIHDSVRGRVLRRDGTCDLARGRYRILRALGTLWHLLVAVSMALLVALVVSLPGPLLTKVVCVSGVLTFTVFSLAFMNAVTFRPSKSVGHIRVVCQKLNMAPSIPLRVV